MAGHNFKIKLSGIAQPVQVKELGQQTGVNGYTHYEVLTGERQSAIYLNKYHYHLPAMCTPQDAWAYYEKISLREHPPVYSTTGVFTDAETKSIGSAIGAFICCEQIKLLIRS